MSAPKSQGFMSNNLDIHRATKDHDPEAVKRVVSRVVQNEPKEDWPILLKAMFEPISDEPTYADGKRKGHAR